MNESLNSAVSFTTLTLNLHQTLQGCVVVRCRVATLLKIKKICVYVNYDHKFLSHYFVCYLIFKLFGFRGVDADDLRHIEPLCPIQCFPVLFAQPYETMELFHNIIILIPY